jgi:ferritin-like metal-binding protein YciE
MDNQQVLQKYLGDMHALESHIQTAIDKQVKLAENDAEAKQKFAEMAGTLKGHLSALEQRLEALGGSATSPVKEAGAAVLGLGAGLIDKMRAEEISKDLRDDYTAASLASISYVMLQTTALACGDQQTAELAKTQLGETVKMLQWIARSIPAVTVSDLQAERDVTLDTSAASKVTTNPALTALYGN